MTQRIIVLLFVLLRAAAHANAGGHDSSGFAAYTTSRIHTDIMGMRVLGGWGGLNTIGGLVGIATAGSDEWRHFHQMNTVWGVVNLGIAGLGYLGARRELTKQYSTAQALHRYEATKRLYLVNAGLDGLYIATGALLMERARRPGGNTALYRGFGKSLILQGAGLLVFDVTMFTAHHRKSDAWYRSLQGVRVTGDGIGWRWVIR